MKRVVAIALALTATSLSGCHARQLALSLEVPFTGTDAGGGPGGAVASFAVRATWDGGESGPVNVNRLDEGFALTIPSTCAIDVEVDGLSAAGVPVWRGERHGVLPDAGDPAAVAVLFAPIGGMLSFPTLAGLPALAGSSATPLDEGRVLVVGGVAADGVLGHGAWIYDQASLSFTPAAPTALRWAHHLALPLGNGLVLLAGGDSASTAIEVYSPSDGGVVSGSLSRAQRFPSAVALDNGFWALGCGETVDAGPGASALDQIDRWPGGEPLTIACAGGRLVSTATGPLAIAPDGSVHDLQDGRAPRQLAFARSAFAAADDGNGGVLVVGGRVGGVASASIEDVPAQLEPALVPRLGTARAGSGAIAFDGGTLVAGGVGAAGNALATAEVLSAALNLDLRSALPLAQAREFPALSAVPGYRLVLVLSGEGPDGGPAGGLDVFTTP